MVGRILDGSSCMTVTQKQSESKERAQGKLRPALRTAAYGSADAHKGQKRGLLESQEGARAGAGG